MFAGALCSLAERGGGRPGAEGRDLDAEGAELDAEGFGQAGDVGLAGGVDGKIGNGGLAGEGADIEDARSGMGFQQRDEQMGQVGKSRDVDGEDLVEPGPIGFVEGAVFTEAGIVDEVSGVNPRAAQRPGRAARSVSLARSQGRQ